MSENPLRIGVIGAGAIGPSHAHSLQQVPQVKLVAVCDQREEAAAGLAKEYGVDSYTDLAEMLKVVDAATLAIPSGLHLDPSIQVIEAGRHLLVEKPLEITTERIDRIIQASEKHPEVKVAGVFQTRFAPIVSKLKSLVDSGLLGEIYSASAYIKRYRTQEYYDSGGWRGTWKIDGGGCLMNQGIHLVDLLLWFCGDVSNVIAHTSSVGREIEVETQAIALLNFSSGARGVIEATTLAYPELTQFIEIYGSRGTLAFSNDKLIRMDILDPTSEESAAKEELIRIGDELEEERKKMMGEVDAGTAVPTVEMGHGPVIEDWAAAIREDRKPLVDGTEARRSVELITAIYESGKQNGKPVQLS
jgi:UDP-N-acetyl-2-amino-2-deoxyglucuronate dehydrogenase